MMEFEEYENPTIGNDIEGQHDDGQPEDTEMMMDEEDIPVTQEDAWAVIRYVLQAYIHIFVRETFHTYMW